MRIPCKHCGGAHPAWVARGDKDDQHILGDVAQGIEQGPSKAKVAGSNPAVISNKRKVGRPKFITDLKAYKAKKQKEQSKPE